LKRREDRLKMRGVRGGEEMMRSKGWRGDDEE